MNGQRTPASALKKSAVRVPIRTGSKTPGPSRVQSRLSLSKTKATGSSAHHSTNENRHNDSTPYKPEARTQTPGRALRAHREEFEVCPVSLNSILTAESESDLNSRTSLYNATRTTISSRQSILASGGARRVILKKNSRVPSNAPRTPSRATLAVTDPIWKAALSKSIEYIESTTPRKVNTPTRITDHGPRSSPIGTNAHKKRLAFNDDAPSSPQRPRPNYIAPVVKTHTALESTSRTDDEPLSNQIRRELEQVHKERALLEERMEALKVREADLLQQLERAELLRDLM